MKLSIKLTPETKAALSDINERFKIGGINRVAQMCLQRWKRLYGFDCINNVKYSRFTSGLCSIPEKLDLPEEFIPSGNKRCESIRRIIRWRLNQIPKTRPVEYCIPVSESKYNVFVSGRVVDGQDIGELETHKAMLQIELDYINQQLETLKNAGHTDRH